MGLKPHRPKICIGMIFWYSWQVNMGLFQCLNMSMILIQVVVKLPPNRTVHLNFCKVFVTTLFSTLHTQTPHMYISKEIFIYKNWKIIKVAFEIHSPWESLSSKNVFLAFCFFLSGAVWQKLLELQPKRNTSHLVSAGIRRVVSSNDAQGSTKCSILLSRMGKHGVSWENMENTENMEKMENINHMT